MRASLRRKISLRGLIVNVASFFYLFGETEPYLVASPETRAVTQLPVPAEYVSLTHPEVPVT